MRFLQRCEADIDASMLPMLGESTFSPGHAQDKGDVLKKARKLFGLSLAQVKILCLCPQVHSLVNLNYLLYFSLLTIEGSAGNYPSTKS